MVNTTSMAPVQRIPFSRHLLVATILDRRKVTVGLTPMVCLIVKERTLLRNISSNGTRILELLGTVTNMSGVLKRTLPMAITHKHPFNLLPETVPKSSN
jgi:hypothetical protein